MSDVRDRLQAICNTHISDVEFGADDNLFELGISSLTLAEIHDSIENEWPGTVDITDLFDYPTVNALSGLLDERLAAAPEAD
ncbi:MAG: hypothetical protein CSB44_09790 [Gammaproteobacteria bacterium]|nr:MAG: hypothetical protein CSB44_09790 [Gammaproteobacteria bacterium]PIE34489.1 MAG: hypothetical protein CSA54_06395 [Gammaproteobacteria bacterium]